MLFQPLGEQELLRALRQSKLADRQVFDDEVSRAIDYLEGRQKQDIEQELLERYRQSQSGDRGQRIYAVTLPLTERYVAEAASIYDRPVTRELVNDAGDVQEEPTKILKDHLERIGFDEHMHQNERLTVLIGVNAVWAQAKRGSLRLAVAAVDDIYPVAHPDAVMPDGVAADPKDQNDYAGFIVRIVHAIDDANAVRESQYALVTAAETMFYRGTGPYEPRTETIQRAANPFTWPQPNERGKFVEMPLQMMTFWHRALPTRSLLKSADVAIVEANRELNIQWSMLFDTIRMQGWSTLVLGLVNPKDAPASMTHGARFPIPLSAGETASALTYATPYAQIVETLKTYVKMLAISLRQSPSDFAIDQAAAVSGFAKLVDSLPKIEARQDRMRRTKHMEEQYMWPRIGAVLTFLKVLPPTVRLLRMRVRFSDYEVPRSPQEIQSELDTNIKYGLDSPVNVLMRKHGISREEATGMVAQNRAESKGGHQDQQVQLGNGTGNGTARTLMGALIGRRTAKTEQDANDR